MANLTTRNNDLMNMGGNFFDDFFHNFWNDDRFSVDIKETDTNYAVTCDLPGFKKDNIEVQYDGDVLSISAKRENTVEDKDEQGNYLRKERSSSSYRRQFMMKNIDEDNIKAKFEDGVLHLDLPKSSHHDEERKQITIN